MYYNNSYSQWHLEQSNFTSLLKGPISQMMEYPSHSQSLAYS